MRESGKNSHWFLHPNAPGKGKHPCHSPQQTQGEGQPQIRRRRARDPSGALRSAAALSHTHALGSTRYRCFFRRAPYTVRGSAAAQSRSRGGGACEGVCFLIPMDDEYFLQICRHFAGLRAPSRRLRAAFAPPFPLPFAPPYRRHSHIRHPPHLCTYNSSHM